MVDVAPIRTEEDSQEATKRAFYLNEKKSDQGLTSEEQDELDILVNLILFYEEENYPSPPGDPVYATEFRMMEKSLDRKTLAESSGLPVSQLEDFLERRSPLTSPMIHALAKALDMEPKSFLGAQREFHPTNYWDSWGS